jgi:uncharacterized protein YodC (DUF2158 family)
LYVQKDREMVTRKTKSRVEILTGNVPQGEIRNMENQKFETGTIVRLKSGGPEMTVGGHWQGGFDCDTNSPVDFSLRRCQWFDPNQNLCQGWFYEGELREVTGQN